MDGYNSGKTQRCKYRGYACLLCHDEPALEFYHAGSVTEGDSAGCWIHFNDLNQQDVISAASKTAGLSTVADGACLSILLQRGPADGFHSLTAASGREEAPKPRS